MTQVYAFKDHIIPGKIDSMIILSMFEWILVKIS